MINKLSFFTSIKSSLFKTLASSQVQGIEVILNEWEHSGLIDTRWLAYMLATAYHETAQTMKPIEEYGRGRNRPYGKKIKHSGKSYSFPNVIYFGRGYVQLTWYENYELMGRLLSIDLLNEPENAMIPKIAARIMFEGMTKGSSSFGDFTGKCLEMYFNEHVEDSLNARKIINGIDKAQLISGYYTNFKSALIL